MKKSLKVVTVTMAASLCMVSGILCGTHTFAHASSVSVEEMKDYLVSIDIPKVFLETVGDEFVERKYFDYKNAADVIVEKETAYLTENLYDIPTTLDTTIPDDELTFEITRAIALHYDSQGVKCIKDVDIYVT